jgi:hypothetical protein
MLACMEECTITALLVLVDRNAVHFHAALHSELAAHTQHELVHGE